MILQYFDSPGELVKYVNDNSIVQADIVTIRHVDGFWYLFHY